MTKTEAQLWVEELTSLLTGKTLISVSGTEIGIHVRQNEHFHDAYFVEHNDGTCVVALSDSYGVMTGAKS